MTEKTPVSSHSVWCVLLLRAARFPPHCLHMWNDCLKGSRWAKAAPWRIWNLFFFSRYTKTCWSSQIVVGVFKQVTLVRLFVQTGLVHAFKSAGPAAINIWPLCERGRKEKPTRWVTRWHSDAPWQTSGHPRLSIPGSLPRRVFTASTWSDWTNLASRRQLSSLENS